MIQLLKLLIILYRFDLYNLHYTSHFNITNKRNFIKILYKAVFVALLLLLAFANYTDTPTTNYRSIKYKGIK